MNIQSFLLTNLANGVMGATLLIVGYLIFNLMTPKVNFNEIFNKDKVGGGSIIIAAFIIGLAIVISKATM
jgi:uncharacterized membrane protein YjfL (UPF0719 family)